MADGRILDVVGLATARLPELERLLAVEPAPGVPPRHLRRRTTSHARRHRFRPKSRPKRFGLNDSDEQRSVLRSDASGSSAAVTERASRRRRRNPKLLRRERDPHRPLEEDEGLGALDAISAASDASTRSRQGQKPAVRWLETHLWHAKRMHMEAGVWGTGWCLPMRRADINCATAIRAAAGGGGDEDEDEDTKRPGELFGPHSPEDATEDQRNVGTLEAAESHCGGQRGSQGQGRRRRLRQHRAGRRKRKHFVPPDDEGGDGKRVSTDTTASTSASSSRSSVGSRHGGGSRGSRKGPGKGVPGGVGCTVHDATYVRPLEVRGLSTAQLFGLLRRLGDPRAPALTHGGPEEEEEEEEEEEDEEEVAGRTNRDSFPQSGEQQRRRFRGEAKEAERPSPSSSSSSSSLPSQPKRALAALLGRREVSALLYRRDAFPEGLLGPAQLLLDPWTSTRSYGETTQGKEGGQDCEPRQEEDADDEDADDDDDEDADDAQAKRKCAAVLRSVKERRLWIWCHPAMLSLVVQEVRACLASAVADSDSAATCNSDNDEGSGSSGGGGRRANRNERAGGVACVCPPASGGGIVRFELRGAGAAEVLRRVLRPSPSPSSSLTSSLSSAPNGPMLPKSFFRIGSGETFACDGSVAALEIHDPRVLRFGFAEDQLNCGSLHETAARFSSSSALFWDAEARLAAAERIEAQPNHVLNAPRADLHWTSRLAADSSHGEDGEDGGGGSISLPVLITRRGAVKGRCSGMRQKRFATDRNGGIDQVGSDEIVHGVDDGTEGRERGKEPGGASAAATSVRHSLSSSGAGTGSKPPAALFCSAAQAMRQLRSLSRGFDLCAPAGWGSALWCALVMAGAVAVGLEERGALLSAAGKPTFPHEFPDTSAGRAHWERLFEAQRSTDRSMGAAAPSEQTSRPCSEPRVVEAPVSLPALEADDIDHSISNNDDGGGGDDDDDEEEEEEEEKDEDDGNDDDSEEDEDQEEEHGDGSHGSNVCVGAKRSAQSEGTAEVVLKRTKRSIGPPRAGAADPSELLPSSYSSSSISGTHRGADDHNHDKSDVAATVAIARYHLCEQKEKGGKHEKKSGSWKKKATKKKRGHRSVPSDLPNHADVDWMRLLLPPPPPEEEEGGQPRGGVIAERAKSSRQGRNFPSNVLVLREKRYAASLFTPVTHGSGLPASVLRGPSGGGGSPRRGDSGRVESLFPAIHAPMLLVVEVTMLGRGVPRCGRAICLPRKEHCINDDDDDDDEHHGTLRLRRGLKRSAPSEYGGVSCDDKKGDDEQIEDETSSNDEGRSLLSFPHDAESKLGDGIFDEQRSRPKGIRNDDTEGGKDGVGKEHCDRPIIGYITSGAFSYIRGRGFGVGLCSLRGLQEAVSEQLCRTHNAASADVNLSSTPSDAAAAIALLLDGSLQVDIVSQHPRNNRKSNKSSRLKKIGFRVKPHLQRHAATLRVRLA